MKVIQKFMTYIARSIYKVLISTLILVMMTTSAFALANVPESITSVEEFCQWVEDYFYYTYDTVDYWQSPAETIKLKSGDCEDYAILHSAYLSSQGIKNWIVLVEFKDDGVPHAICIWHNTKKTTWYISSNMHTTTYSHRGIAEVLKETFSTIKKAWILIDKEKYYKTHSQSIQPLYIPLPMEEHRIRRRYHEKD